MANWKEIFTQYAANAEEHMDALRYRLHYQLGGVGPIKIIPYRGYGSREKLYLRGRVLEDRHIQEGEKNDDIWDNLLNMYRRLESNEVPHARLAARFQGSEQEIEADEEGFFEVRMPVTQPLAENRLWHAMELELLRPIPESQSREPVKALGQVLVPPPSARQVIISDIDDTIIQTDVAHLTGMARNVFLGNAHTRLPFPGVAALYRALFAGKTGLEMNPLFYVSSSPWNLYDLLAQFFNLHRIPIGPVLFLRDWGLTPEEIFPIHNAAFKTGVIRQMLDFYPDLPFILIGDSGQEDPEIYANLAGLYPKRIQAVYIRNVSRDLKRPEAIRLLAKRLLDAGSTLVLADDTVAIARHAIEHNFISPEALPAIEANKEEDEAPPTPLETLLGEMNKDDQPEAPTVQVDRRQVGPGDLEKTIKETGAEDTTRPPTVVVEDKNKKNKENGGA